MKKKIRKNKIVKTIMKVVLLTVAMILLSNIVDIVSTKKHDIHSYNKVDSILVHEGDTLWGIAHKIDTVATRDPRWTVEEIKLLNKMTTSDIQLGQSLIVPVFPDSLYWDTTEAAE